MRAKISTCMTIQAQAVEHLADELEQISYYGIGHAMGDLTESDVPQLAAIARRVAPDRMGRLRVSIALAVRRAVLLLDPPKHREAAAAAMWLDLDEADFDEDRSRTRKPLKDRHPEVAALLGKGLTYYERTKGWRSLYEQVAVKLLTLDQASRESGSHDTSPASTRPTLDVDAGLARTTSLVESGAALYYAALTSLFVADFHNTCVRDVGIRARPLFNWDNTAQWLFTSLARFIDNHAALRDDAQVLPKLPGIPEVVHQSVLLAVDRLVLGAERVVAFRDVFSSVPSEHDWHAGEFTNDDKFYNDTWRPWYRQLFMDSGSWPPSPTELISHETVEPYEIDVLVAIGEQHVKLITEQLSLNRPVLAHARRRVHQFISTLYEVDDWLPLGTGGSLQDRVDSFFDEAGRPSICEMRNTVLLQYEYAIGVR